MQDFDPDHIDEEKLDAMLREAMLARDEKAVETQELYELSAGAVFSTEHFNVPDSPKGNSFLSKYKHRSGWNLGWMNSLLGAGAVGIVSLGAWMLFHDSETPQKSPVPAPVQQGTAATRPEAMTPAPSEENTVSVTPSRQEPLRDKQAAGDSVKMTPQTTNPDTSFAAGPAMAYEPKESPRPVLERDEFPVLTYKEIHANDKRKAMMIADMLRLVKAGYMLIPHGTLTYKGKKYPVKAFYMRQSEITNREYKTFLIDLVAQGRKDDYKLCRVDGSQWTAIGIPSYDRNYFYDKKFDDHPVVNISRDGALMYCKWLTEEARKKMESGDKQGGYQPGEEIFDELRLPEETEWAWAAKSGSDTALFANGMGITESKAGCLLANYKLLTDGKNPHIVYKKGTLIPDERKSKYVATDSTVIVAGRNKYCGDADSSFYYTVKVTSFNPSGYNLYCMAGNVAEMVYANQTGSPATMGGSWNSTRCHLSIEGQDEYSGITTPSPFIGFRPVMILKQHK